MCCIFYLCGFEVSTFVCLFDDCYVYVFLGLDGVQGVGDFGEFLYFQDSSGVFEVVQWVL